MKKTHRVLLSLFATGLSAPAFASDWVTVTTAADGAVWSVDAQSLKEVQDGYSGKARKAWIKIDFSAVKSEPAREAKVLFFFKCDEEQAKSTTWVEYKSDGTVYRDLTSNFASYKPTIPDTVLNSTLKAVCGVNLSS